MPFARAPSNRRRKRALTTASQAVRTAPSGALGAVNLWRRFTHRNGGGPFRERRDYPAHLLLFLLGPAIQGFGFIVSHDNNRPAASFVFETEDDARAAQQKMEEILAKCRASTING